jgi:hypothetical protein
MQPKARTKGLIVRALADELVVYDVERHEAHCLNPAAATVFKSCDGTRDVPRIAERLRREISTEADESWAWLALDRLEAAHLMERRPPKPAGHRSRRDVLRRARFAAVLPIVVSVLAPSPAMAAASCVTSCTGPASCTPCSADACLDCGTCVCCNGTCVPAGTCIAGGC